ncbi:MAG: hypothetical protein WA421_02850 [Nitrososphaeraceae archaeon]
MVFLEPTLQGNYEVESSESADFINGVNGLLGPHIDKPVTALNDVIKNNSVYVTVRTLDHQTGEIQGQIY